MRRILVTGATGAIGTRLLQRIAGEPALQDASIRAFGHVRPPVAGPRVEVVGGNIIDRGLVRQAMAGVSHVIHLAAGKNSADAMLDVAVKGTLWLLDECIASTAFRQFIVVLAEPDMGPQAIGGAREDLPHILPAVILEQFQTRHNLNGCCLRATWAVTKNSLRRHLSFTEEKVGVPFWHRFAAGADMAGLAKKSAVPILLDADGRPLQQNFVHMDDLVDAVLKVIDHPAAQQETFRFCMDEPFDYGQLTEYLRQNRGLPAAEVKTPLHSKWIDNAKARILLGWRPKYNLSRMLDEAFEIKS